MSCRPGETNLSIHCLPCKHADLSSVLESRWKQSQTSWCTLGIPAVGEESEEDPGACLSNQPSLWSEVQANTRFYQQKKTKKEGSTWGIPRVFSGSIMHSLVHRYTCTIVHKHIHAHAHTYSVIYLTVLLYILFEKYSVNHLKSW